jgi:hypothetical protein
MTQRIAQEKAPLALRPHRYTVGGRRPKSRIRRALPCVAAKSFPLYFCVTTGNDFYLWIRHPDRVSLNCNWLAECHEAAVFVGLVLYSR